MSEIEKKISSSLFGGYNKKSTEAYIGELQTMITKLQEDLASAVEENERYVQKFQETESSYKALQERGKEWEDLIERQKSEIRTNENVIKVQKETIRLLQEDILKLEKDLEDETKQVCKLNEQLEEKERMIKKSEETAEKLKDELERQQWLQEQPVENKERIPVSKIERFVQKSVKKIVKRKR